MTRYIVFEPGEGTSAQAVFLRDRFHAVAFLLPFVWLAAHKLFLASLLALLASAGLIALGQVDGFGFAANALSLLFGVAVALEGPRLVARRLTAKGYREADIVNAADLGEAELLYYGTGDPLENAPAQPAATPPGGPLPLFEWQSAADADRAGPR